MTTALRLVGLGAAVGAAAFIAGGTEGLLSVVSAVVAVAPDAAIAAATVVLLDPTATSPRR